MTTGTTVREHHGTHYLSMFDRNYLGHFDLQGKEVTVTINKVLAGDLTAQGGRKSKKPIIYFEGKEKGMILNKTNSKTIAAMYGAYVEEWVGKRITLWMQDFTLDAEELLHRLDTLRFRGVKGTTGTQASFLELFDGDDAKVRELDLRVARQMGFPQVFPITGQTYPRKLDAQILACLAGVAQSAAKFATDLRLLQHEGEILEPAEAEQVGSSAMPYKRNPMRAERVCGLARYLVSLRENTAYTAATQWLERTLDDSANRRLVLPEAALAADAILILVTNIVAGLDVREGTIRRNVERVMPFMATERWLMLGVQAGGDRQTLHEVIRRHSRAVGAELERGAPNDLLDRLARDPAFARVDATALRRELEPRRYVGRAPEQVVEYLEGPLKDLLSSLSGFAVHNETGVTV